MRFSTVFLPLYFAQAKLTCHEKAIILERPSIFPLPGNQSRISIWCTHEHFGCHHQFNIDWKVICFFLHFSLALSFLHITFVLERIVRFSKFQVCFVTRRYTTRLLFLFYRADRLNSPTSQLLFFVLFSFFMWQQRWHSSIRREYSLLNVSNLRLEVLTKTQLQRAASNCFLSTLIARIENLLKFSSNYIIISYILISRIVSLW